MDVGTVLNRLVAAAATASVPPRQISPFDYVPDDFDPPAIYPEGVKVDFDQTHGRGTDKITVRLRLLCARTDDREGQHQLYRFLAGSGAGSVKAAIEAARGEPGVGALDGACDDLHVREVGEARWYEHAGERLIGADLMVDIWGDGA
jgi:hypothetical protein